MCTKQSFGIFCSAIFLLFASIIGLVSFTSNVAAQVQPQILYEATDLADTNAGQDLWEYTYFFTGVDFLTGQGWTTFFAPSNYSNLVALPSPNSADWDVLVIQPDPVLPDRGFYDAQAQSNSPALDLTFHVLFVWLGVGKPGAQSFTFYNSDFSTRSAGETSVPLTLLTSGTVTGPFVPETNAVWSVTNRTFTVPITSTVLFFSLVGPLPTRIVSIRVVGNHIVIKYELIQSALLMAPPWSLQGSGLAGNRHSVQPRVFHARSRISTLSESLAGLT